MTAALLILGVALGGVSLEGDSTCPEPSEVGRRLESLMGDAAARSDHRVEVQSDEEKVRLVLRDAAGRILAERELPSPPGCEGRAAASAAIIAAWEFELLAQAQTPAPRAPLVEQPAPPVPPQVEAPTPPTRLELAAGLFTTLDVSAIAPALELSIYFGGGKTGATAGLWGLSGRELRLGSGVARWQRAALELGAVRTLSQEKVRLDVHGGLELAVLSISGSGFRDDLTSVLFDPGVGIGLRVEPGSSWARGWLGMRAILWMSERILSVGGLSQTARLPIVEVLLGMGVTFDLRE